MCAHAHPTCSSPYTLYSCGDVRVDRAGEDLISDPLGCTSERTRALPHRGPAPVCAMVRPRQNHWLVEATP